MLGVDVSPAVLDGAVLIGLVLVEAILLYVGYGALEKVFGPTITDVLRGE